jgi:release factor glutamine methyltransferase
VTLKADHTIKSFASVGEDELANCSDSVKLDVQILLSFVLQKDISYLFTWPDKKLSVAQGKQFMTLLSQRKQGKPIAYLIEHKEFWSLDFFVSPATLIPRPDTESLVELILSNHCEKPQHCLDLGTGSGVIALALASERQQWKISAVDYSSEAVALAKRNAIHLNYPEVNIYQSNWFEAIDKHLVFDVIVSNPPYIDKNDHHLAQGDVRFEPSSALVSGNQGLADIIIIIEQANAFLTNNGYLYIEHGYQQAQSVRALLQKNSYYNVLTVQDLNGNDRITYGQYSQ